MSNDLIIKNATLYSDDFSKKRVSYIGIRNGKIAHIGDNSPDFSAPEVDFGFSIISKPFCDYHYHLPACALYDLFGINLSNLSVEQYKDALSAMPDDLKVIRGFGWEISSLAQYFSSSERTPLELLDELFPSKCVVLFSLDFHSCWCNSVALSVLERNGIECAFSDSEIPNGEKCILHEDIAEEIFECDELCFTDSEIERAILREQERLIGFGVCEVYSLMFIGASYLSVLKAVNRLFERGELKIKINYAHTIAPSTEPSVIQNELKQIRALLCDRLSLVAIKIYADGVIDNHSALLLDNYSDKKTKGFPIWDNASLDRAIELALSEGLPIHAHAIGDGAVEQIVCALSRHSAPKSRHIVAHLQLCSSQSASVMAQEDIVACMQPFWFYDKKNALDIDKARLGDRVERAYPVKMLLDAGVKVLFSSDCPATSCCNPLTGIRVATELLGECSISRQSGYYSYLVGSYFDAPVTISTGDSASFIVLDGDIVKGECTMVTSVYIDGNCIF